MATVEGSGGPSFSGAVAGVSVLVCVAQLSGSPVLQKMSARICGLRVSVGPLSVSLGAFATLLFASLAVHQFRYLDHMSEYSDYRKMSDPRFHLDKWRHELHFWRSIFSATSWAVSWRLSEI
jgi:hypothetical protein